MLHLSSADSKLSNFTVVTPSSSQRHGPPRTATAGGLFLTCHAQKRSSITPEALKARLQDLLYHYWGYTGIMDKKMETTTVYWGYIEMMDK